MSNNPNLFRLLLKTEHVGVAHGARQGTCQLLRLATRRRSTRNCNGNFSCLLLLAACCLSDPKSLAAEK